MKVLRRVKSDKAHANINIWSLKLLSTAILVCMASSAGHTTDLEIYQGATYGNASIMMMLDNSGSMGTSSISSDYSAVSSNNGVSSETLVQSLYDDNGDVTNTNYSYSVNYVSESGTKYYDRMSRLKMALMPLFANPKSTAGFGEDVDLTKYKIGLGNFFYRSGSKGGGKIENPIVDLTLNNRKKIISTIIGLQPETNTPMANAYAEAGAYMLGTRASATAQVTENINIAIGYTQREVSGFRYVYSLYACTGGVKTSKSYIGNFEYYSCNNNGYTRLQNRVTSQNLNVELLGSRNNYYENGDTTTYFRAVTRVQEDNVWDGFDLSAEDTKEQSHYQSPVSGEATQCDGYGVYFLTDGEPNNSYQEKITRDLMSTSLVGGSVDMNSACSSGLTSNQTTFGSSTGNKPAWECIGEYSKALYDESNSKSVPIATATVGFGNVYKELANQGKITKKVTRLSGVSEVVQVYQCDHPNVTSQDAKNLCKLGEKGEGYGEGGFYYTEDSEDIANSVKKFIEDVSKADIDPISAGTMSVPLDSLGGLKSRQFAYLPILEPVPSSSLLWNGNLKKYKVENATLVGSNNNAVFSDSTGLFAQNTSDEWNTITNASRVDTSRPDGGAPQVGGAYQKVFENATSPLVGNRNLFVDNGSGLTNLKVSQDKKPSNFDALTTANGYDNDQKLTLLNFMGYSEPTATTVTDNQALTSTQDKLLKNVGGVLHSIPQLITQKIEVDTSGQFDQSTREDYIIYGSMDGALHMLDDSTGKETFTFIPKQILDLQPAALVGTGSAKDGSYPYGVDAPWLTYVSYTTKSTPTGTGDTATTTNTYESNQSLALGGLRMGGSMYYALDVSDVKKPKIIYGVGSNYANRLKGSADALGGTKNNITGASSAEQKAFARMGQSWGKPTLGYVKSGGKKVMVSFLPGGYDTCYEDPTFKLGTSYPNDAQCDNKSAAQGNALYMVQMGEVETKDNGEETVNTEKNNGNLLWWASNEGASDDSTTRTSSLQYSKSADLKHSVVTQIRALDRNYDGLIDHLYFADLGGQVWRVDINNDEDTANFKIDRVVKVLDVSDQAGSTDAPPRFYERPLITFYNGSYAYTDASNASNAVGSYSGVQAMITVGTGDRSNPVTAERKTPDALYTVIDKDLTRTDLFDYETGTASTISLRTPTIKVAGTSDKNDKLQELTFSGLDIGTAGIRQRMEDNVIQGWYMPFSHWLGDDAAVSGKYKIKMFNEPDALASVLISSSFNPDEGQKIQACSAGVIGETQRERTCLPYGSCPDASGNETVTLRSTFNAGSGIVDNIISQYNDTSLFTSLTNTYTGNAESTEYTCTGDDCDIEKVNLNVDKRINPLSWLED